MANLIQGRHRNSKIHLCRGVPTGDAGTAVCGSTVHHPQMLNQPLAFVTCRRCLAAIERHGEFGIGAREGARAAAGVLADSVRPAVRRAIENLTQAARSIGETARAATERLQDVAAEQWAPPGQDDEVWMEPLTGDAFNHMTLGADDSEAICGHRFPPGVGDHDHTRQVFGIVTCPRCIEIANTPPGELEDPELWTITIGDFNNPDSEAHIGDVQNPPTDEMIDDFYVRRDHGSLCGAMERGGWYWRRRRLSDINCPECRDRWNRTGRSQPAQEAGRPSPAQVLDPEVWGSAFGMAPPDETHNSHISPSQSPHLIVEDNIGIFSERGGVQSLCRNRVARRWRRMRLSEINCRECLRVWRANGSPVAGLIGQSSEVVVDRESWSGSMPMGNLLISGQRGGPIHIAKPDDKSLVVCGVYYIAEPQLGFVEDVTCEQCLLFLRDARSVVQSLASGERKPLGFDPPKRRILLMEEPDGDDQE